MPPSVGDLTLIHVQLPPTEAERLEALFRSTEDRKLRDRLQIVLMAHRGRARQDIARRTGLSKTRRMQEAFAAHLRHVGRTYPREKHPRVVLLIDNAPWHRGRPVDEALAENPHLEFKRLPSYSPQLNPIERFWKKLRRRATHNRLFDTLADLKTSLRASLCYFQTVRHKVKSIIEGRPKRKTNK